MKELKQDLQEEKEKNLGLRDTEDCREIIIRKDDKLMKRYGKRKEEMIT